MKYAVVTSWVKLYDIWLDKVGFQVLYDFIILPIGMDFSAVYIITVEEQMRLANETVFKGPIIFLLTMA